MKDKIVVSFLVLVFLNILVLDYWIFFHKEETKTLEVKTEDIGNKESFNALNEKVLELESKISTVEPTKKIAPIIVSNKKTNHVSYVNISGGFGQIAYEWTDVPASQFYFNKADYLGLKEIKFESNMKLFNGNGKAFVRLFDVTHGVAVNGSQVETSSQNDVIVTSESINFMDGKNLIKVQIKSLTADSAVFNSGRLVVTSEY
jgi:hypothetical protein